MRIPSHVWRIAPALLVLGACSRDVVGPKATQHGVDAASITAAAPIAHRARTARIATAPRPLDVRPGDQPAFSISSGGTRAAFMSQGTIAFNYGFDDFGTGFSNPGDPWTTNGVTYTTGQNLIVGTASGYSFPSNVLCYNLWSPMQGTIAPGYDMFGFDVGMLGSVTSVTITLTTNQGTYVYPGTSVAHWTAGGTFAGFIAGPGEHFTGFHLASAGGSGSAPCLDNVTLGTFAPPDNTPPSIVPTVTGTLGANDWYTSDVEITWAVTDDESAIVSSTGCDAVTVNTDQASVTYTCSATSAGGTGSQSVTVKRDASAPVIDATVAGVLGNNGWYTSDVGVSFTTTDATSGIASSTGCEPSTLSTDTDGQSYTCSAKNGAGLSAEKTVTVKRDATDPLVGYSGNAGTYTVDQAVSISCAASDAMSGLASTTCADISGDAYTFGLGSHSFSADATDNAGNDATATTSFTVTVTTGSLCTLVERWVQQAGVANSLCQKLDAAAAAAARGNTNAKLNILGAFINELEAQSGKAVAADLAATLIALAGAL